MKNLVQITRRKFLVFLKTILGFFILFTPIVIVSCYKKEDVPIYQVYDGDTVRYANNKLGRILGIDAVEMKNEDNTPSIGVARYFADKARRKLIDFLASGKVSYDIIKKDSYGRDVIKIKCNGKDAAIELLKEGLVRVAYISNIKSNKYYLKDGAYAIKLYEAQYQAYLQHKGIWSNHLNLKDLYWKIK